MRFEFNEDKNQLLFQTRGLTFEMVLEAVQEKGILDDFPHPNFEKYPNQRIFVVELDNYTYCVPYVMDHEKIFLKTIFPSRKHMILIGGNDELSR